MRPTVRNVLGQSRSTIDLREVIDGGGILHHGLEQLSLDSDKLVACFDHYLALEGKSISRAVAEQRMLEKALTQPDRGHRTTASGRSPLQR